MMLVNLLYVFLNSVLYHIRSQGDIELRFRMRRGAHVDQNVGLNYKY